MKKLTSYFCPNCNRIAPIYIEGEYNTDMDITIVQQCELCDHKHKFEISIPPFTKISMIRFLRSDYNLSFREAFNLADSKGLSLKPYAKKYTENYATQASVNHLKKMEGERNGNQLTKRSR